MDQLDLSFFFQTKAQASDFSARLSLIMEKIYNTTFDLEKTLIDQLGLKKKDAFMSLLRENKIDSKNATAIKTFITSLIEYTNKLPVLSLVVAFEPKEKTLQKLSQWSVLNLNKQAIFDITVDPTLIGGAAIDFNGKHMDFSIRPQFDQIVTDALTPKKSKQLEEKNEQPLHQGVEHLSV